MDIFTWTEENVSELIKLKDTKTADQIAAILGTSRGSVMGKLNRMSASKAPVTYRYKEEKRTATSVRFEDLNRNQCRYPQTEGAYCAGDVHEGKSYCFRHWQICISPVHRVRK